MENKKINVSFGIVTIAFLLIFFILIKDFNSKRINDFNEYVATVTNIVKQKNNKIIILAHRLMVEQKENEDLKNTLADTRNSLDAISKKLAQPVAAPASVPVPATAPAPVAATK